MECAARDFNLLTPLCPCVAFHICLRTPPFSSTNQLLLLLTLETYNVAAD